MADFHVFEIVSKTLPKFTNEKDFSSQVVNLLGENLGFHSVSLYLVDESRQNAVLLAGYGKFAKSFLAHGHKLSLSKKGLVVDVINSGEIQLEKPIHPMPFCWGHEFHKCEPPVDIQINTILKFQVTQEAEVTDWRTPSIIVPPIGWEICLPMRLNGMMFGAIDFQTQLSLDSDEKRFWKEYLLTETDNDVKFSISDCSKLQWLIDFISSNYKKAQAL